MRNVQGNGVTLNRGKAPTLSRLAQRKTDQPKAVFSEAN